MKRIITFAIAFLVVGHLSADDITTLDGQTYHDVRDVSLKPKGLFFVAGEGSSMAGVTVPYDNLPEDVKEKYHYDPFEMGFNTARQDARIYLNKNLAFSLDNLEAAKKKAKDENKMLGFILVWDTFFVPSRPMGEGSNDALAQFYDVFHDGLVLVFVSHERERDKVPDSVKQGFFGPEEGGWAPNMCVVTADCSQFVCEVPYGAKDENGTQREEIFRKKIAVIKNFKKTP
jgi:hypothetical protein